MRLMGVWLIGQKGGSAWAPKRGKMDVPVRFFSPACFVMTVTAQTSCLRELSSLILHRTRFAYASIIIVV